MPETPTLLEEVARAGLASWDAKPFLEKVTDIVPSIIYVFNQQTQSNEYTNRSLGTAMGFSPEEIQELGAAFMPTLCHPDDLPRMALYFENLRQMKDGEVSQFEYRMKHRNGGWTWLLSYDTIFERDETGAVLRHIGVAADITKQKEAEELALAQKRAADAANEELGAFAYSISHDLKSPSNTLNMLLDEFKHSHGDGLNADGMELIDLSLRTVGRMRGLIEDVLEYTRVIGQEPETSSVSLAGILPAIVDDLNGLIASTGGRIQVEDLPVVKGNARQLGILMQNLLSNALKFHRADVAPEVRVFESSRPTDSMISITVSDNGIGIEKSHQDRIFGMFQRLHHEDDFGGIGLGLSICRRIAITHGGDIGVTSTPGEGSVFTITLPRP